MRERGRPLRFLALCAGPACLAALLPIAQSSGAAADIAPERPLRLLIVGLDPGTQEAQDWVGAVLEETLARCLARTPGLAVIPRAWTSRAASQLAPDDRPGWARVARHLGANALLGVCGRIEAAGIVVDLELQPLASPAPAGDLDGDCRGRRLGPARIDRLIELCRTWVTAELGVATPGDRGLTADAAGWLPRSDSGVEAYGQALRSARAERLEEALYWAGEALDSDPQFRPALLLLAELELRGPPAARVVAAGRLRLAAELARRSGDSLDHSRAELLHALLLVRAGSAAAAVTRAEHALVLAWEADDPYAQVVATSGLCDIHLAQASGPGQGEASGAAADGPADPARREALQLAAHWQRLALERLAELSCAALECPAASRLAVINEQLGRWDEALQASHRMERAAQILGQRPMQGIAWLMIARQQQALGHPHEALEAFQRTLLLTEPRDRPMVRLALADLYAELDAGQQAVEELECAWCELGAAPDAALQVACLSRLALLRDRLGNRPAAVDAARAARDCARRADLPEPAQLEALLGPLTDGHGND